MGYEKFATFSTAATRGFPGTAKLCSQESLYFGRPPVVVVTVYANSAVSVRRQDVRDMPCQRVLAFHLIARQIVCDMCVSILSSCRRCSAAIFNLLMQYYPLADVSQPQTCMWVARSYKFVL